VDPPIADTGDRHAQAGGKEVIEAVRNSVTVTCPAMLSSRTMLGRADADVAGDVSRLRSTWRGNLSATLC
jgi:hypothetical protein